MHHTDCYNEAAGLVTHATLLHGHQRLRLTPEKGSPRIGFICVRFYDPRYPLHLFYGSENGRGFTNGNIVYPYKSEAFPPLITLSMM